ncbi:thiolase C-terminal domain-containing protein [Haloarchaeobius sp. DFWS5]|uniref:thiolase C-terminal domain-containing protein n=1 Tax=Haloarchaeobius sp. DFWS5 TaxID=3446114 RepID=UPI003EB744E0
MQPVRIAGVAVTPFGDHSESTGRELFAKASTDALTDSGVHRADIDEVLYGNFIGEVTESQGHQGPLAAEVVGTNAAATRFESACASGGVALRAGVRAVRSGDADVVLVGGMERMSHVDVGGVTDALALAADDVHERRVGMTFPGAYALLTRAYFREYGGTREDLAAVAVKNHDNALANENAHLRERISTEDVLTAPAIAEPVGLYDACPISDGAAAVVLVSDEYADANDLDASVAVTGTGQRSDTLALQRRLDRAYTPATEHAAADAYDEAGITPADVDLVEVHDCFTIAEVLAIEALGFYDPGAGIDAAATGETTREGGLPVNLSGGLKAKGHPVGATGVAQLVELTKLLRGDHHHSDSVPDAEVGLAHNAGGTVASAVVHVVEVVA